MVLALAKVLFGVVVALIVACKAGKKEGVEEKEAGEAQTAIVDTSVGKVARQEQANVGAAPEDYWWYEEVVKEYLSLFCKWQKTALSTDEQKHLEVLKNRIDSLNGSISDPQERMAFTRALNWLASPQSCKDVEL